MRGVQARYVPGRRPSVTAPSVAVTAGTPWASRGTGLFLKTPAMLIVIGFASVVARLHEIIPGIRFVKPVMLIVIAIVMASSSRRNGEQPQLIPSTDPSFKLLIMYWAWMAFTIPTSVLRGQSLEIVINLAPVVVFATMIMVQPASPAQLRYLTRGYILVCAVFSVALIALGKPMFDGDSIRYSLNGSLDPNDSAAVIVIGIPMALAEAKRSGAGKWRLISWGVLAVMFAAIVRTGSRGGMIAAVIGLLVVALSSRGVRALFAVLMLGAALATARQVLPPALLGRFAIIGSEEDDYNVNAYSGRWQIWQRGIKYFAQDPVLGVGVGGFPTREGLQLEENGMRGKWSAAHNSYVQAFAELGVIGGVLFVSLLVTSVRRLVPVFRQASPVTGIPHPEYIGAVVAFASSAFFLSHAYFWGFFALVGLCALAAQTLVPSRAAGMRGGGGGR